MRSCWGSAFAVDPLRRLEACGLGLDALELAVLLQPEITPVAGGVARIEPGSGVSVAGVRGHPGPLLSGWAEGARDGDLANLTGPGIVEDVAGLAGRVHNELGDDHIEWAASNGKVWLLQSQRSACPAPALRARPRAPHTPANAPAPQDWIASVAGGMALAAVWERGIRVPAEPASPGMAAGPLVACRPHEPADRGAILLVDRPLPAVAPLLFGARGVISRSGAAGSHLAAVARSLGVPMVTGCHMDGLTGGAPAPGAWLAAVNGSTGGVALLPA